MLLPLVGQLWYPAVVISYEAAAELTAAKSMYNNTSMVVMYYSTNMAVVYWCMLVVQMQIIMPWAWDHNAWKVQGTLVCLLLSMKML